MWTFKTAQQVFSEINKIARQCELGAAIGGSVVDKGNSDSDLDIIFHKLKSICNTPHQVLLAQLESSVGLIIIAVCDHAQYGDDKLVYKCKLQDERKIDLFFVHLTFDSRIAGIPIWKRKVEKKYDWIK